MHDQTCECGYYFQSFVENSSGQGQNAEVPAEIKKWNWGAFALNLFWALDNELYLMALFCLIPGVNLVVAFILGATGNEMAWKLKRWDNLEEFERAQKKWSRWGIIFFCVILVLIPLFLLGTCLKIMHVSE